MELKWRLYDYTSYSTVQCKGKLPQLYGQLLAALYAPKLSSPQLAFLH